MGVTYRRVRGDTAGNLARRGAEQMTFVVIGGLLFLVGLVMTQDVAGVGTRWREVGMRFYDRRLGPDAHDRSRGSFASTTRHAWFSVRPSSWADC